MLKELHDLVNGSLPELLKNPGIDWQTLDVMYEDPHVERVWIQLGENRLNLHKIYPCEKPLFHSHPWPSAVMIISGKYEMVIGNANSSNIITTVLCRGSEYEMTDPSGYHSVKPLDKPSYSIMLTGKPWSISNPYKVGRKPNKPLTDKIKNEILSYFYTYLVVGFNPEQGE